jgi:hypothetical protein
MLKTLGFSLLFVSANLMADTLNHPTCNLYLVTDSKVSSYGAEIKELLQARGYFTIERDNDQILKEVKVNDLALSFVRKYEGGKNIKPNTCSVTISIQRVASIGKAGPAMADLRTAHSSEWSWGGTIKCLSAYKSTIHKMPKCKQG